MKSSYKIDDYTVKVRKKDTGSNYNLSVQVFKDKELICGTIMNENSKEKDILKFAIDSIETKPFDFTDEEIKNL